MTKTTYRVELQSKDGNVWNYVGQWEFPNIDMLDWKTAELKGEYYYIEYPNGTTERWLVGEDFDDSAYFAKAKRERFQLKELRKYIQNFYTLLDDENTPDNVLEATKLVIDEYETLERKWVGEV